MRLDRLKYLITGIIVGVMLTGAIGYASDSMQIDVKIPKLSLWLDDKPLSFDNDHAEGHDVSQPKLLQYKGSVYVPVRPFAEAMDKEVLWDEQGHKILIHTIKHLAYEPVNLDKAPQPIIDWLESSKMVESGQVRVHGNDTYILITRGEKRTGGYQVEVEDIARFTNHHLVTVRMTDPPKGNITIQPIEYPFALVKVRTPLRGKVVFQDTEGDPVSSLIDSANVQRFIPEVIASTEDLAIFHAAIEAGELQIEGMTRGFEGLVRYFLLDEQDEILAEGMIHTDVVMPHWGIFEQKIDISTLESVHAIKLNTIPSQKEKVSEELKIGF